MGFWSERDCLHWMICSENEIMRTFLRTALLIVQYRSDCSNTLNGNRNTDGK